MMKKMPMVSWYNPKMLVQTGIRVAISTVFGQFADRREAMAAANAIEPQPFDTSFNYSKRAENGDFWFDFAADSGDGWNSTYAVARLLAKPSLTPAGSREELQRGRVLLLGGDQVYPTASRQEYGNRLLYPLEQACRTEHAHGACPDLYAIPGNHDWYDGLNSFFGLFCRRRIANKNMLGVEREGRRIGCWQTQQTRSYFAIELPHNWWVWGSDSQLEGYIDQPQIDYFDHAARYWMKPESKLILCVGSPAWVYQESGKQPKPDFNSFSYLEWLATRADRGHHLKLILTGDSHHYARYTEDDRQYVTCGGGGAFLHPTHQLKKQISFPWHHPKPGERHGRPDGSRSFTLATDAEGRKALYPSRGTSWGLAFGNIWFAFVNPWFTATLFAAYLIFNWVLDFHLRVTTTEGRGLADSLDLAGSFKAAFNLYRDALIASPAVAVLMALALAGYIYFADFPGRWGRRIFAGGAHWVVQTLVALGVTWLVVHGVTKLWGKGEVFLGLGQSIWALVIATACAAFASATVFGLYLLFALNVRGKHWNEAFSSMAISDYKCFLRLRIDREGALTIHPIGLTRVPIDDGRTLKNPQLKPHLIEQPIRIPPR